MLAKGAEPRLFVARMLSYGGKPTAARKVLENLLEADPACDEARALLQDYANADAPSRTERSGSASTTAAKEDQAAH